MDWTPSFSGTATIRVRSIGCDDQRSVMVEVSVIPQAITTPTLAPLSPVAPISNLRRNLYWRSSLNVKSKQQTNCTILQQVTTEI